jgi:hypothetical protein
MAALPKKLFREWWRFSNFSILCGHCWCKLLVCFKTFIYCEQLCNNAVNYPSTPLKCLWTYVFLHLTPVPTTRWRSGFILFRLIYTCNIHVWWRNKWPTTHKLLNYIICSFGNIIFSILVHFRPAWWHNQPCSARPTVRIRWKSLVCAVPYVQPPTPEKVTASSLITLYEMENQPALLKINARSVYVWWVNIYVSMFL